jgi:hypothetical protein
VPSQGHLEPSAPLEAPICTYRRTTAALLALGTSRSPFLAPSTGPHTQAARQSSASSRQRTPARLLRYQAATPGASTRFSHLGSHSRRLDSLLALRQPLSAPRLASRTQAAALGASLRLRSRHAPGSRRWAAFNRRLNPANLVTHAAPYRLPCRRSQYRFTLRYFSVTNNRNSIPKWQIQFRNTLSVLLL